MRPERLYLSDILDASKSIALHIAGRSQDEFIADRTVRAAVLHELTVIGEAASRVPMAMRDRHPSIPWVDIVAFRNVVVHPLTSGKSCRRATRALAAGGCAGWVVPECP